MSSDRFTVFFDGADYVIALNEDHATRLWEVTVGLPHGKLPAWQAIAPDEPIAIDVALTLGGREFETMRIAKTAAQWCKAYGIGFLCSTES